VGAVEMIIVDDDDDDYSTYCTKYTLIFMYFKSIIHRFRMHFLSGKDGPQISEHHQLIINFNKIQITVTFCSTSCHLCSEKQVI